MNITVIGLGYVGLVNALVFDQQANWNVIGVDIDKAKTDALKAKELYIQEPGLDQLVKNHTIDVRNSVGDLFTTPNYINAKTDAIIVCVGTPSDDTGAVNLNYVYSAMKSIGIHLESSYFEKKPVVILKSTVPPGTSEKCIYHIEDMSGLIHGEHFGFVMSPEFLQEGEALKNINNPDKIVIGHRFSWEADLAERIYTTFISYAPLCIIKTNYVNAEFIKYANNAFLATKISFINEMANFCELIRGADIKVIADAIGHDRRINPRFLRAGLGYGGSCFTKDLNALIDWGEQRHHDATFFSEVQAVNGSQRDWPVNIILDELRINVERKNSLEGKRIAILGLTFKPDTDDIRDAPSIDIIEQLRALGAKPIIYDPTFESWHDPRIRNRHLIIQSNVLEALNGSDCAVLVTEWDEFKDITPETFNKCLRNPLVIDGRRIYDPKLMKRNGIKYYGVGYGASRSPLS